MKLKIKSYAKYSDTKTLKLGNRVSVSLKGNEYFPDAGPIQSELETKCQELNVAISLAGRNDRTLSSAKNDRKAELIEILDRTVAYVTAKCNGDATMLLSSGFDFVGGKTNEQTLAPIEKFIVVMGGPGVATTRVNKVSGAKAYIHKCTPDPITPDSVWVTETSTDRENTFNNLNSIAKYWFQVIAVGKDKQYQYSTPVSIVIQ